MCRWPGCTWNCRPAQGGLGFSKEIIGFGAGIFFWGYWILEVPSTLSVLRWGARYVFVRILVLWGLSCMLIGTIGTPFSSTLFGWLPTINLDAGCADRPGWHGRCCSSAGWRDLFGHGEPLTWFRGLAQFYNGLPTEPVNQFYFFRFMLGFFEGGFFPSVILYLSLWFRAADRAKAIANFMAAIPVANVFGLPISGLLLELNWFGWPGLALDLHPARRPADYCRCRHAVCAAQPARRRHVAAPGRAREPAR